MPVWNRLDLLQAVLGRLRAQTRPIAQILVVDDGSRDNPADVAEAAGARCIPLGAHAGFTKAVNRGITESRTPLVAILNNDVDPAPDWLARLAAALSPELWFATGKILQSADPVRMDATYDLVCRGGTSWRVGHGCRDAPVFQQTRRIRSAPLTAALFRIALFEKIGLLDERFESYLEDVDFGLRCAQAGCAGIYVPDAVARHQGSATLGRWHSETTRLIARNQVFIIAKHYPSRLLFRYAWPILIAQALWGLVAIRHGRGWAWVRGKFQGLRRWGEFRQPSSLDAFADFLHDNELEIRKVQQQCAPGDLYWKLYFLLTPVGQSDTT